MNTLSKFNAYNSNAHARAHALTHTHTHTHTQYGISDVSISNCLGISYVHEQLLNAKTLVIKSGRGQNMEKACNLYIPNRLGISKMGG